jgi:hypothetical protein
MGLLAEHPVVLIVAELGDHAPAAAVDWLATELAEWPD